MSVSHRNIRLLSLHNFCGDFRPYTIIAILYFAQITGSYALGMLVHGWIMVSAAIFELPTGVVSDFIGRKKTMILGSVAALLGVLLFAVADSLWLLLAGALFQGLSRSFYSGNNEALIHDSLSEDGQEEHYPDALGRTRSMYQLALGISAVVGALIAPTSFRWAIWASVLPQALALIVSFFFVEPKRHTQESTNVFAHLREAVALFARNAKLRLLTIGSVIWDGFGETIFYLEPVFITMLWPVWGIGVVRVLDHSFGWLSYWYAGRVIRRFGSIRTLLVSLTLSITLGTIAFGFPTIISPVVLALSAIPYGFILVSHNTLMQKEFSQKQRATMGSLDGLLGNVFFGICAMLMGWVADLWSPVTAMLLSQLVLIILLPLYWRFHRMTDNPVESPV